jgi:hypothetical protein
MTEQVALLQADAMQVDTADSPVSVDAMDQLVTPQHAWSQKDEKALLPTEFLAKKTFVNIIECEFLGGANAKTRGMPPDAPCECDESDPCGPDSGCVNRTLLIECVSCPMEEKCLNRRFQKRTYAKVEIFRTETKGFGLKTLQDLPEGSLIREYVGEVITMPLFAKRTQEYAEEKVEHFYFMSVTPNEIIDATKKGNISRFMNHSCNPNSYTERWIVRGRFRIGLLTNRFVPAGTELTFDYQFQRYGKEAQICYCGEDNCRGIIGGDDHKEVDEYEEESVESEVEVEGVEHVPKPKKMKKSVRSYN